jgi:hypothetical protein
MASTTPPNLQAVSVDYEYSRNLSALIEELQLSIVVSTYQAGREIASSIIPEATHDIPLLQANTLISRMAALGAP